jgi:hypothetical protein
MRAQACSRTVARIELPSQRRGGCWRVFQQGACSQVLRAWEEWEATTGEDANNPDDFVAWALNNKDLAPQVQETRKLLRRQVTDVLRQALRTDEDRLTYRAKQCVKIRSRAFPASLCGLLSLWVFIRPRDPSCRHVENGLGALAGVFGQAGPSRHIGAPPLLRMASAGQSEPHRRRWLDR